MSRALNALPKTVVSVAFNCNCFLSKAVVNEFVSIKVAKILLATDFNTHFNLITIKIAELSAHPKAAHVAVKLQADLEQAKSNFIVAEDPLSFKEDCIKAIKESREELEKHRGWSQVLSNFASAVVSLFTFGLANCLTKSGFFGLFPMQTDSSQKLNALEAALHNQIRS